MPYHVTCRNCGLLLYSAAPITERVCQRCGADLPAAEQGAPPPEPSHETGDEALFDAPPKARAG